ncbi:MAG TPA: uroporphyrinogen-III C-methyltransferase [Bryobacteraceae bacterium]|nr:uroporphyrinogen-III C-methyltransferase [Bryobacteraceae bacterium]
MSKVWLVGAGPGDPLLITLRGRDALAQADVVLYDHLAPSALLRHVPKHCEQVYVGKKRSAHACSQAEIIDLLLEHARQDRKVVRLKGGDPYLFGRGGEEAEALAAAGISFEVVPGVTAPLGIAAYTGVPLTHRDLASSVTFITGHDVARVDWEQAARSGTLVVFMGVQHLPEIVERLAMAGKAAETPAMAVRWGTRSDQQVVAGRLGDLPLLVRRARLLPPATLVIGDVVALRHQLDWRSKLPLTGKRVILTRAHEQAHELSQALRELGADPLELPVIELRPVPDPTAITEAVARLPEYHWVVFTSVNAVQHFLTHIRDLRRIRGRVCAIGPATADALASARLEPDLVPATSSSEGVAEAFRDVALERASVLLPRAAEARDIIPQALQAAGAHVDVVDLYRNVVPEGAASAIDAWKSAGGSADWITFTSGSTVKNWLALAGRESLARIRIASIGPSTSDVIRRHGLAVDVEADPHTTEGLVAGLLKT